MELETNTGTCILQIDLINVAFEQKPKHHGAGNKHRYMYITDLINVAFEQKPKHHGTGNKHSYMCITNRFDKCSI